MLNYPLDSNLFWLVFKGWSIGEGGKALLMVAKVRTPTIFMPLKMVILVDV